MGVGELDDLRKEMLQEARGDTLGKKRATATTATAATAASTTASTTTTSSTPGQAPGVHEPQATDVRQLSRSSAR